MTMEPTCFERHTYTELERDDAAILLSIIACNPDLHTQDGNIFDVTEATWSLAKSAWLAVEWRYTPDGMPDPVATLADAEAMIRTGWVPW